MSKMKMPTVCAGCGKDINDDLYVIRARYPARWVCLECGEKIPEKPKKKKMRKPKMGDRVLIDYGTDADGQYWWKSDTFHAVGGPFATEAEAEKNAMTTLFGSKPMMIRDGGQWDPAWDKKQ